MEFQINACNLGVIFIPQLLHFQTSKRYLKKFQFHIIYHFPGKQIASMTILKACHAQVNVFQLFRIFGSDYFRGLKSIIVFLNVFSDLFKIKINFF